VLLRATCFTLPRGNNKNTIERELSYKHALGVLFMAIKQNCQWAATRDIASQWARLSLQQPINKPDTRFNYGIFISSFFAHSPAEELDQSDVFVLFGFPALFLIKIDSR